MVILKNIFIPLPRANANKDSIQPFTTMGFFNDTGLPNSDGSISERSFTWRPSLEKMLEKDIHPDFRWFDAGWYFDPAGNTVEIVFPTPVGACINSLSPAAIVLYTKAANSFCPTLYG